MVLRSVRALIGIALFVHGVRAVAAPAASARSLQSGPPLIDDLLEYAAENPRWVVSIGAGEMVAGLWLALL